MIKELIIDIAYDKISLSQALTRAKLIANKIQNKTFTNWISKELNGYENNDKYLPSYRNIWSEISLVASYPFGQTDEFPLRLPEDTDIKTLDLFNYHKVAQPIAIIEKNIEDMEGIKGHISLPTGLVQILGKFYTDSVGRRGGVITSASRMVGKTQFQNIIELTKQKLLDTLLNLENQFPEIDNTYTMSKENDKKVSNIITNNIYGNNNPLNVAAGENISQGDINLTINDEHKTKLKELGVEEESLKELEIIDQENPIGTPKRKEKIMGWLGKVTASLASRGIYDNIPRLIEFIGTLT